MPEFKLWVGGYTTEATEGVATLKLGCDGTLTKLNVQSEGSPSYLAKQGQVLYTAREAGKGVGAFTIKGDALEPLAECDFGAGPCHIYAHGNRVYAACYGAGVLAALKLEDGKLICDRKVNYAELPFADGRRPHTHMVTVTPDGKYVLAVDLGLDNIVLHKLDCDGCFDAEPCFNMPLPTGFGPRHLTFSNDGRFAYVCGEYSNKVVAYAYEDGKLKELMTVSALPADFEGTSYCAGLRFTQDGRFLLVTNRGHNTIAVFPVDCCGMLGELKTYSVGGDFPREFALSPDEKYVLCADQKSDTIDVLSFDKCTGAMEFVSSFKYPAPTAVLFE